MRSTLDFYNLCMKYGNIPIAGLCNSLREEKYLLSLFTPTDKDMEELKVNHKSTRFWASDLHVFSGMNGYYFTPLRQNIVLFIAAMKGEL